MTYTLFYVAEGEDNTWQVRSEDYPEIDSVEPIEGTDRLVTAGFTTEDRADYIAHRHQVRSYTTPKKYAQPRPTGVDPKFVCDRCGAMGEHYMEDCDD